MIPCPGSPPMPIQVWSDRIWVLTLADEPALSEDLVTATDLAERAEVPPEVVIDFSAVTRVGSVNLSQLLTLRKISVERGVRMKIAGLADAVWVAFLTTGLDKVFDFMPDVPSALAALQIDR